MNTPTPLPEDLEATVARALAEDLGAGDRSASLVTMQPAAAQVCCRVPAVLCGSAWFTQAFLQLDAGITCHWLAVDGDVLQPQQEVCRLHGPAAALLSGERTALNFLQLLSGTATLTRSYVQAVAGSGTVILDTRKTLPGLRSAQKYAVVCGGGQNHRRGLYDKVLLKENHIAMLGGVEQAARTTAANHGPHYEIEVEDLAQLRTALDAGALHIMLDNFNLTDIQAAVRINAGRAHLEASGGIRDPGTAAQIAATGVHSISIGALTHSAPGIDYSMQLNP